MGNDGFFFGASPLAVLMWGLLSAVGVAVYSVSPVDLLYKYGTLPIVGFGMLLSGIVGYLVPPTKFGMPCGMYGQLLAVSMLSFLGPLYPLMLI